MSYDINVHTLHVHDNYDNNNDNRGCEMNTGNLDDETSY